MFPSCMARTAVCPARVSWARLCRLVGPSFGHSLVRRVGLPVAGGNLEVQLEGWRSRRRSSGSAAAAKQQ